MKNRKADFKENTLISPADSTVYSQSKIESPNDLLIVKNTPYKLDDFLFGKNPHTPLNLKQDKDYYQVTLYLSPGDCHRYFSPGRITVEKRFHNLGWFHPVKPDFVKSNPKTFLTNERVTLKAKQGSNALFITYVSALNVGDIVLNFDEDLKTNAVIKTFKRREYADTALTRDYIAGELGEYARKQARSHYRPEVSGDLAQIREEMKEFDVRDIISFENKGDSSEIDFIQRQLEDDSLDLQLKKNLYNDFGGLDAKKKKLEAKLQNFKDNGKNSTQTGKGFYFSEMEEMGMFKFGSTIALIFEVDKGKKVDFRFNPGDKVKIGERLFDLI